MKLLVLCEGNADSWNCWSGTAKSIVDQLRLAGHTVSVGDVDLQGTSRWAAAGLTISASRRQWATRYHLGAVPFEMRSWNANRLVAEQRTRIDAVLQIGATFQVGQQHGIPYYLCCDSNIRMAEQGKSSGYSDASALTAAEVQAIARRELAVYRKANGILTLSEQLRRSFVRDFGIPQERVRAIYAGPNLDLTRIPPTSPPRAKDHTPTILFVGLQFHRKGGDLLIESFRKLTRQLPAARLVLVGPPAAGAGEPGVTCVGELDKRRPEGWAALLDAYASADVFALPTRFEPFGIAFVEAMHFGLPCVGPQAWAVPEIIEDGQTGFTVPPEDVEALTDRLLLLLRDRERARAMGNAARERARQLFTWPRTIDRMMEIIQ